MTEKQTRDKEEIKEDQYDDNDYEEYDIWWQERYEDKVQIVIDNEENTDREDYYLQISFKV